MGYEVYFVDSLALAVEKAQSIARRRYGHFGLIRKVEAGDIVLKSRLVKVQLQIGETRVWFTVQMQQTESGWAMTSDKEENEMNVTYTEIRKSLVKISSQDYTGAIVVAIQKMDAAKDDPMKVFGVVEYIRTQINNMEKLTRSPRNLAANLIESYGELLNIRIDVARGLGSQQDIDYHEGRVWYTMGLVK